MSKRPAIISGAFAAALILAVAVWIGHGRIAQPNVLLITLDTTRADFVGCYGMRAATTPALDRLAAEGVRFTRAFCNVPLTLPSHATIMTGLYPPEHGSRVNGVSKISGDVSTLAERFSAGGYATAGFAAAVVLDAQFGLDRGFDVYDDHDIPGGIDPRDEMALIQYRRGEHVADAALSWLRERPDKPFFCWVHFFDPHRPYYLDEPLVPLDPLRAYEREVAYMDRQVARLMAYLEESGLLESTVVVALGDHGEALGEHGENEHGLLLYDEVMRVPLIVRMPDARGAGRVSDATVSTVGVMPTLLELARMKIPERTSGRSFARVLRGKSIHETPVYMETDFPSEEYGWSPLRAILNGNLKYVRAPREEIYDLAADPAETNNLVASRPGALAELRALLEQTEGAMTTRAAAEVKLDAAARRALASLGYAGGGGSAASERPGALRDPKDAVWMRTEFMDAQADMRQGLMAQAEGRLVKLVAESPESLAFHYKLGELLFGQNRFEEARAAFQAMAQRFPDNYAPHYNLGKTLIKLGAHDRAIGELELAIKLDDTRPEVHNNLGLAHIYKGEMDEAAAAFRRSLALDGEQIDPHSNLGHVLLQQGKTQEAIAEFRRALQIAPEAVGPRYNLGLALLQAARHGEAAREFEQVARARPDFADVANKLRQAVESH